MAILVTGGAGYIGSHMVLALLDHGHDVVVIDRLSTGFRASVAPEARFYLGDIADQRLLRRIFVENSIDAVLHFAASSIVPESVLDPLGYYRNNVVNAQVLLEETLRAGIEHFIFSSSAAVYGAPAQSLPVCESDQPRPQNPYGHTKWMVERILADVERAHPRFRSVCLRYFNVIGADHAGRLGQMTKNATHLVKLACETALGLRPYMRLFGTDWPTPDGTCIRDFIDVNDLVAAHLKALCYLQAGNASLIANCGYGQGASVREVIAAVEALCGEKLTVIEDQRRVGDAHYVLADIALARDVLGFAPAYPGLNAMIASALDWEKRMARKNMEFAPAMPMEAGVIAA